MVSPKTKSGQKKLSEVARHIVIPKDIVTTAWPSVRDRARDMGVPFDQWQDGIGRLALAKRCDGLYAAGMGGVVLSIPRQVGKTYLIAGIVFAMCTLNDNLTVIWTAHRTRTHNETFKKMQSMASKRKIAPYLVENRSGGIRATNGEQEISFKNGSRILFGARESGFGRGFDKVDVLVLDEAQILTEDAMSDMVPATNASPNGLVFLMGTPPRPKDPGEVFTDARERALDGDPDTVYVEFSADENADVNDRKQLEKANPSYPHRTTHPAIVRMKKLLGSDESFRREGYGIWDKKNQKTKALNISRWKRLVAELGDVKRISYGVKFSIDGSAVALVAAFESPSGAVYLEPIRQENLGEGIDWLVEELVELAPYASQIVIDGKAGSGSLITALHTEGVRNKKLIITPTADQVIAAHSVFEQDFISGVISHGGHEELTEQVGHAEKRKIGNAGGFGWAAPEGETVVLLDAATLALWGVKTTKRTPLGGGGGGLIL